MLLECINNGQDMLGRHATARAYQAESYMGHEGFPSLADCPHCGDVPGFFDILGLDVVASRAEKNGYFPNSSAEFDEKAELYAIMTTKLKEWNREKKKKKAQEMITQAKRIQMTKQHQSRTGTGERFHSPIQRSSTQHKRGHAPP